MPGLHTYAETAMIFGICVEQMKEKLVELNLSEARSNLITVFAVENGLGLNKEINMGDRVHVVSAITDVGIKFIDQKIEKDFEFISDCLLGKFNEVKIFQDKSNDGMHEHSDNLLNSVMAAENFYEMYEKFNDPYVKHLFYKKLEKNDLLQFAKEKDFFYKLEEIAKIMENKEQLEKVLQIKSTISSRTKI